MDWMAWVLVVLFALMVLFTPAAVYTTMSIVKDINKRLGYHHDNDRGLTLADLFDRVDRLDHKLDALSDQVAALRKEAGPGFE